MLEIGCLVKYYELYNDMIVKDYHYDMIVSKKITKYSTQPLYKLLNLRRYTSFENLEKIQ